MATILTYALQHIGKIIRSSVLCEVKLAKLSWSVLINYLLGINRMRGLHKSGELYPSH